MIRPFVTVAGVATVVLALASSGALAQDVPSYAAGETIDGTIASITGKYALTVDDERGFVDSVTLHDGTVIEPTGVSLEVGQVVTITGHTDGSTFDADEIDTDGSDSYATAGGGAGFASAGDYPPYVVSLGDGAYYYGTGGCCFGGYGNSGYYYVTTNSGGGSSGKAPPGGGRPLPIAHPPLHPRAPVAPPMHAAAPTHAAPAHATPRR